MARKDVGGGDALSVQRWRRSSKRGPRENIKHGDNVLTKFEEELKGGVN